jgi:hypothetical protein
MGAGCPNGRFAASIAATALTHFAEGGAAIPVIFLESFRQLDRLIQAKQ